MKTKNLIIKRILPVFIIILVILATIIMVIIANNNKDIITGYEIQFPVEADATLSDKTLKSYDVKALEKQLDNKKAYIYSDPKLTDYKIVSDLGFNVDDYSLTPDADVIIERRKYVRSGNNGTEELRIDKYGCFSYWTGTKDTYFEFPYSIEQTIEITKQCLIKYGLWNDDLIASTGNETGHETAASGKMVIGRGVNYFYETNDRAINERVSVDINGNGEIIDIIYYVRNYNKKQEVELISIDNAFQKIDQGKAFISMEYSSKKLIFDNVSIKYWIDVFDPTNAIMQPVYVFKGTSIDTSGEEEPFVITVQANKVEDNKKSSN